ncbi:hypothetical protein U14_04680 [Candidatus Moduliflexus flocculans]|uniref:Uncharacterized protein n=1 Tax=Candidatus Moduliflexus flocculans TaxID=1499966 RepID=A0A0S6W0Y6_9BACT|nr:hypothetical protein U14_04680 [Candidatus Moduliflexus flocculans]
MKRCCCLIGIVCVQLLFLSQSTAFGETPLERLTRELEPNVALLRGLLFQQNVEKIFQTPSELGAVLDREFARAYPGETLHYLEQRLLKFGFVVSPIDLRKMYAQLLTQQIAGYYDPITKKLALITGGTQAALPIQILSNMLVQQLGLTMEQILLSHELTHALQDQHFDLMSLPLEDLRQEDAGSAAKALIEGDAMLVMIDYMLDHQQPGLDATQVSGISDNMRAWSNHPLMRAMMMMQAMPRYLSDNLMFSYLDGFDFVLAIKQRGGWEAVNKAYADPPRSTEQILHPEKYLGERDLPVNVELPDCAEILADWQNIEENTLGEFNIRLLLDGYLPEQDAIRASAGWGGDRFALYQQKTTKQLQLIWRTVWDSKRDSAEFFRVYRQMLEKRYVSPANAATPAETTSTSWQMQTPAGIVRLERRGSAVMLIDGASEAQLSRLRGCLQAR